MTGIQWKSSLRATRSPISDQSNVRASLNTWYLNVLKIVSIRWFEDQKQITDRSSVKPMFYCLLDDFLWNSDEDSSILFNVVSAHAFDGVVSTVHKSTSSVSSRYLRV